MQCLMQQIYNVCPIMDYTNKQNFIKEFEEIQPFSIQDIIEHRYKYFFWFKQNQNRLYLKTL